MGTWIGHLRIAEILCESLPGLDISQFVFGSLAPDSGLPNEDWSKYDPPKEITHFLGPGEAEGRTKDLDFFNNYLSYANPEDRESFSFLQGYFAHLICDNLWSRWIVGACRRDYETYIAAEGMDAWNTMKLDWYGLDHRYVREHPDCFFWRVLMKGDYPPTYLPYLPVTGIHHQLDHIRSYYSQPDPERDLDRPFPYLNEITMERYVEEGASVFLEIMQAWDRLETLTDSHTALAVIADERLQPFSAPLGDELFWGIQ